MKKIFMHSRVLVLILLSFFIVTGCTQANGLQRGTAEYEASLLSDLEEREDMPQTDEKQSLWYTEQSVKTWGPMPRVYPSVDKLVKNLPAGTDITQWKRDRVIAIAKHYVGLPYRHHHIPGWAPEVGSKLNPKPGAGLDCSNFTAWVYNFGFGISFNSDVGKQSELQPRPGYSLPQKVKRIGVKEGFLPGDLLYILDSAKQNVVHVVIYVDKDHIIDSTGTHVDLRHFTGWYRERLSHGIRVF